MGIEKDSESCDRYWKVFAFICDAWNKEREEQQDSLTWRENILWELLKRHHREVYATQSKADPEL